MTDQMGNHLILQEGLEEHELYWRDTKKQTRFAPYRIRRGIKYAGLIDTVNKPHGLEYAMRTILDILWYKGYSRWSSVVAHANKKVVLADINDAIEVLIKAGIIAIYERNERPSKGLYFTSFELTIDPRAEKDIESLLPKKKNRAEWEQQIIGEVEKIRTTWEPFDSDVARKLEMLVTIGVDRLTGKENEAFPVSPKAKVKFRSALLTIAYSRALIGANKTMPLRTLSSLLWQNTKILDRYRKTIEAIIGIPLEAIGIPIHPETVWLYGEASYQLEGKQSVSLTCGLPSVLSEQTVQKSKFKPDESLKLIIIVENLTVFQTILNKTYYLRNDVLIMWSEGYWSNTHRRIIRDLLRNRSFYIYIWADIDGDGLQIAYNIYSWVNNHNGTPKIILMGENEWKMADSQRVASERDLEIVQKDEIISLFPEVAVLIHEYKKTVEQERLLVNYNYIETQLP